MDCLLTPLSVCLLCLLVAVRLDGCCRYWSEAVAAESQVSDTVWLRWCQWGRQRQGTRGGGGSGKQACLTWSSFVTVCVCVGVFVCAMSVLVSECVWLFLSSQVELESAACSGLRCIHPVGLVMLMRCAPYHCCLLRAPL